MDERSRLIVDLVVAAGAAQELAVAVCEYIANRCATLTVATALSSPRSALRNDQHLTDQLRLNPEQIAAWIGLIRGSRAVKRPGGRVVGGCPGLFEALATGHVDERQRQRFVRLAGVAAGVPVARRMLDLALVCSGPTISSSSAMRAMVAKFVAV
jgi:hypothetical protein